MQQKEKKRKKKHANTQAIMTTQLYRKKVYKVELRQHSEQYCTPLFATMHCIVTAVSNLPLHSFKLLTSKCSTLTKAYFPGSTAKPRSDTFGMSS